MVEKPNLEIKKVGVAGCGLMGSGIAEVAAARGFEVVCREIDDDALAAGRRRIEKSLEKAVAKEKLTPESREEALARMRFTTETAGLAECDIVVEAVVEDLAVKTALFRELDGLAPERTIFASNTSSLTVTDLAAATKRPDRFVGLHFFNPVPVMKLVEVVRTIATSNETFDRAFAFAKQLGKVPIAAKDNSGFVVNLLLVPYMMDAIRQLEAGVASIEEIDKAMTLGCGYPMGPFVLGDFVGLDTLALIGDIMFDEYRESRYAPPPLLRRLVALGRHGKKTGAGFYDWEGGRPVPFTL